MNGGRAASEPMNARATIGRTRPPNRHAKLLLNRALKNVLARSVMLHERKC